MNYEDHEEEDWLDESEQNADGADEMNDTDDYWDSHGFANARDYYHWRYGNC